MWSKNGLDYWPHFPTAHAVSTGKSASTQNPSQVTSNFPGLVLFAVDAPKQCNLLQAPGQLSHFNSRADAFAIAAIVHCMCSIKPLLQAAMFACIRPTAPVKPGAS